MRGQCWCVLVAFFYVPIFLGEMHTPAALEGMNYVGDTLLFGATVLLAGWGAVEKSGKLTSAAEAAFQAAE